MAITPTDFEKIWSTNASTPEYTFSDADYLEGWDFVGNLPPTRAQWNAIQKRTDEKMKYVFDNFGAPLIANTVAEMTLQNRVYVYMGSEVGYTAGDWYYYDAGTSTWVDGGVYNAVAIVTDTTLTQAGVPADAKATGDAIALKPNVDHTLTISGAAADAKVTGDNVFYIKDEVGISLPITKTITTSGGTISTGVSSIMFNAREGEVLKYKISGAIFTASSAISIFLYKSDGTLSSAISTRVNDEISMILPHDITGAALRLTNLNAGSIDFTVQRVLPNNKIAQIEQNTANIDAIQDGYVYNGNPVTIGGSISSTGKYVNQSIVYKDVITNPYKIYTGIVFDIDITLNNGQAAFWFGYAEYDANNNFLRRVMVANSAMSRFQGSIPINDADASYVRFNYRTFGSATAIIKAQLGFVKELDDKIDNMDTSVVLPSVTVPNIAHRGDDILAPQCTAPAYIAAKKRGFSIAENDLFYSQDGVLVMWHDTTLALLGNMVDINGYLMYTDGTNYYWVHPTTNAVYTWDGNDYVASAVDLATLTRCNGSNYSVNNMFVPTSIGLNFDVLRRIDFGVWKGQQFAGTQILTFEEWILLCKQLGMGAYVDRKLTYTDEIITEAANTVKRLGMSDYTSWLGVYAAQINKLRTIIPHARCGVLTHPTAQNVVTYAPYNVDGKFFFNGDARKGMTAEAIHTGLDAGFEVEVWYVEYGGTAEDQILAKIREAVSYGVTGITLDHYRTNDAFAYLLE